MADHERLEEIRQEMLELIAEARQIVLRNMHTHRMTYERMKAYWGAQIEMALQDKHNYLGSAGATMEEAVRDLEPYEDDEEVNEDKE